MPVCDEGDDAEDGQGGADEQRQGLADGERALADDLLDVLAATASCVGAHRLRHGPPLDGRERPIDPSARSSW